MTAPAHPLVPPVPPLRVGPRSDGGNALWIDPDRAQGVIDQLTAPARQVDDLWNDFRHAYLLPAADDAISQNVAHQANRMTDNARAFCQAYAAQLDGAATQLAEQLAAYQATDEDNRRRLAGGRA
ncbi:MAG: PE domain-containing protein [Pseudonocardia sp.]